MARRRLDKARAVRQELSSVYYKLSTDEIDNNKARTLTYIMSILLRALETSDLEQKIEQLEEKVDGMKR